MRVNKAKLSVNKGVKGAIDKLRDANAHLLCRIEIALKVLFLKVFSGPKNTLSRHRVLFLLRQSEIEYVSGGHGN